MILNPPTGEGLVDVALTLHFSVWERLVGIIANFDTSFSSSHLRTDSSYERREEWDEYIIASQPDLRSILPIIQQSNELALKARLCAVSPYLLLIGSDVKLSSIVKDFEFDDLRTLNADELPRAVNSLTPTPISQSFLDLYNRFRMERNKIMHLGLAAMKFDPYELLHDLIALYSELWRDRAWLQDRLEFSERGAIAFFDDGRHWSIAESVMLEWGFSSSLMTGAEFKKLFHIPKSKRRYACISCVKYASTKWSELEFPTANIYTAYLKSNNQLFCLMCQSEYTVRRRRCSNPYCKGDVIAEIGQGYKLVCHTCRE